MGCVRLITPKTGPNKGKRTQSILYNRMVEFLENAGKTEKQAESIANKRYAYTFSPEFKAIFDYTDVNSIDENGEPLLEALIALKTAQIEKQTETELSDSEVNEILKSTPEIISALYEAENLDVDADVQIVDNGKELNLSEEEIKTIHTNYTKLMNKGREGDSLPFKDFVRMFENTQVFKNKDTYFLGQWDKNNLVFQIQLISAPTSFGIFGGIKKLKTIANVAASVPEDLGKMLTSKKFGFYKIEAPHESPFRGKKIKKNLYFSSKEIAEQVFKSNAEDITSDKIKEYDSYFNRWKLILKLKKDFEAGNLDNLFPTLKSLGIYDKNALAIARKIKSGEFTKKDINEAVRTLLKMSANNAVKIQIGDRLNNPEIYKDLNTDLNKSLAEFLSNFGIKTETYDQIQESLGVDAIGTVDIINKIIKVDKNDQSGYPEEAGRLIAFMMQHNPLVTEILGDMDRFGLFKSLTTKEEKLKVVGDLIAEELHNKTNTSIPKSLKDKIKLLVKQFLKFVSPIRMKRINRNIGIITDNILVKNQALITASTFKPGAEPQTVKEIIEKSVTKVDLQEALKTDEFAESIVDEMAATFILTGSITLAEQGTIFRPNENQVHDLDWVSPLNRNATKKEFLKMYPEAVFLRDIEGEEGYATDSWIIPPKGYRIIQFRTVGENKQILGYKIQKKDTGEIVSSYRGYSDSFIHSHGTGNIEGKIIDIFSYEENQIAENTKGTSKVTLSSGKKLKIANWKNTFGAKISFGRLKDLWDYNRYIPNDNVYGKAKAKALYKEYRKTAEAEAGSEKDVEDFKAYIKTKPTQQGEAASQPITPQAPKKGGLETLVKPPLPPRAEKKRLEILFLANQGYIKPQSLDQLTKAVNDYNRKIGSDVLEIKKASSGSYYIKTNGKQLLQLESGQTLKGTKPDKELNMKLAQFLAQFGISIQHLESLQERTGVDAVGAADIINKIILISKGKEDANTLPEEAAHFVIELLGDNHPLVQRMLEVVKGTEVYNQVVRDYGDIYNGDEELLLKEAAGKMLADAIIDKNPEVIENTPRGILGTLQAMWNAFLDIFKNIDEKAIDQKVEDVFGQVADSIFKNEISEFKVENLKLSKASVLFQKDNKRDSTLDVMKNTLEKQQDVITKRLAIFKRSGKEEFLAKERKLLTELETAYDQNRYLHGNIAFLQQIRTELAAVLGREDGTTEEEKAGKLKALEDAIANPDVANLNNLAGTLRTMKGYFSAYGPILAELKDELDNRVRESDNTIGPKINYTGLRMMIKDALDDVKSIENKYYELGIPVVAKALKEFAGDRGVDKDGNEIELDIEGALKLASKDISTLEYWLDPLAETNDPMLMLIDKMVKFSKQKARLKINDIKNDLLQAQSELEAAGIKDTDWMYERLNGKLTGNIISDINYAEFEEKKKAFTDSIGPKPDPGTKENKIWGKKYSDWIKANTEVRPEAKKIIEERQKELSSGAYAEWAAENIHQYDSPFGKEISYKKELIRPKKSLYANKKFNSLSSIQKDFHAKIMKIKKDADKQLPLAMQDSQRAPQIRKDTLERIREGQGVFKSVGKAIGESVTRLIDDDEFGVKAITDEQGRPVNFLPIYYVKQLGENLDAEGKKVNSPVEGGSFVNTVDRDLSTQIVDNMLLYANMAENYGNMNKILNVLELSKDIIELREVTDTDPNGNPIVDMWATAQTSVKNITKAGAGSLSYKRLSDYYEMIVYGQLKEEEGNLFGTQLDKAKTLDAFGKYVAINNLAINVFSGIANLTFGGAMMRTETMAGEFVDNKDLLIADKIYHSSLPGAMGEIGKRRTTSKLNLWLELMDTLQDHEYNLKGIDSKRKTRTGQLMKSNTLFFINHAGEHWLQTRMSLALANRIKLKDENGNEINLYEAYEIKGNNLKLKKGLVKADTGEAFTETDLITFINRQNFVNKRLHGIYNDIDKNVIQKYALGRLALMFRKFIVPGVNRRFEKMKYNEEGEAWVEGYYRTTWEFLKQLVKDIRKGQYLLSSRFNELNNTQRANLMRTMTEVAYVVGAAVLANVLTQLSDDDDENWLLAMSAYQSNRLYTELRFYTSADEAFKILKSPAAGVSTLQDLVDFLEVWTWGEDISKGKYAGMNFFERSLIKGTPVLKGIYKAMSPEEELIYFK